ncbi:MAG: hypothetical protein H0V17_24785 [Deltaproteobacteria bacterium]|nr:hypothetical protein [Deltaproteobacteria bacterium]
MRLGRVGAIAGLLLMTATAGAVVPRKPTAQQPRIAAESLTAMPAAKLGGKTLRTDRGVRFNARASAGWSRFAALAGGKWRASWDQATGVPSRIWGSGVHVFGANGNAQIAERAARAWLAAHLDLLAPGSAVSDFVLVSNHDDGDQRSVGFVQYAGGKRVVGGQVSFRFKRDRLFVIGSEALPDVYVEPLRSKPMAPAAMLAKATTNLRTELALPNAPVKVLGDAVVLPLIADDAVIGYRIAVPHEIDGRGDGRYLAYVDPASGGVLAVHQQNRFANGTVLYRTVNRHPGRGRVDVPAHRAQITVGGASQTTGDNGAISWSPDIDQTITTAVLGDFATIVNKAEGGVLATAQLSISPAGSTVWDATASEHDDAQVSAWVSTNTVKDYVRTHLDAGMPTLDDAMTVNVNIAQTCNAFYDGKSINFFVKSENCDNTALLEDVVFHEFGHHLHSVQIIEGVGAFDGAMSEGASDFLATLITNDSGMGRGFFLSDAPLRELDPVGSENVFPNDVGEIHKTGIIYGGAFFDLRKALFAKLGEPTGRALIHKLFLATLRRSVSIQSALIETLASDDDDGDLTNGTPNECAIRDVFGSHGLRTATGSILAPGVLETTALATVVRVDLEGLSERCAGDDIQSIQLDWRPSFTALPAPGLVVMEKVNDARYFAKLPLAIDGSVLFKAVITFTDQSHLVLADNFADPYYQVYQGATTPLYCIDFEQTNPFADGWTTETTDGSETPWEFGVPPGTGPSDPPAAFTGSKIIGQVLGGDYNPKQYSVLRMPPIDTRQYSDVRLQFRRWLAVEDSEFDKARVTVNGRQAWINFTANKGQRSTIHHIDREWRFTDISVSGYAFGHTIDIAWDLQTDEGLNLGGWAIDDVCVVANKSSICGDGIKNQFELCDDGPANADVAGACRTYCLLPTCGDNIVDDGEACDEGFGGTPTCSAACDILTPEEAGCCSSSSGSQGALALGALVGLLMFRRRRT